MTSEFDDAVAVRARDAASTYDAVLDSGWQIGAGINGGLLLALAANAGRQPFAAAGHADPLSISAYYLSASRPGSAELAVESVRAGRTMSTGAISLLQRSDDGVPSERLRALATFGDLDGLPDDVRTTAQPPELAPVEECVSSELAPAAFKKSAAFLDRIDLRLDPDCVGWAVGAPSGRGLLKGWLRLADGREPDPLMLLLAVDALPPVTFDLGASGWTPTLELTAHVRARPARGWLRVQHSTRNVAGGLLEEDAEVWDSGGRLVAQSRQLARMPR